ncbi:MAG: hypothetical protein KDD33_05070 [Bdellovibrionales bacterium]|nr:hypothetical protein [Bdellovibrionales bacterium]
MKSFSQFLKVLTFVFAFLAFQMAQANHVTTCRPVNPVDLLNPLEIHSLIESEQIPSDFFHCQVWQAWKSSSSNFGQSQLLDIRVYVQNGKAYFPDYIARKENSFSTDIFSPQSLDWDGTITITPDSDPNSQDQAWKELEDFLNDENVNEDVLKIANWTELDGDVQKK